MAIFQRLRRKLPPTYQRRAQNLGYSSSGVLEKPQIGNGLWETAQLNSRLQVTQLGLGTVQPIPAFGENSSEKSFDIIFWKAGVGFKSCLSRLVKQLFRQRFALI